MAGRLPAHPLPGPGDRGLGRQASPPSRCPVASPRPSPAPACTWWRAPPFPQPHPPRRSPSRDRRLLDRVDGVQVLNYGVRSYIPTFSGGRVESPAARKCWNVRPDPPVAGRAVGGIESAAMDEEQARIRGYLVAQGAKLSPAAIVEKVQQAMAELKTAAAARCRRRGFGERPAPEEWSGNEGDGPCVGRRRLLRRQRRQRAHGGPPFPRSGGRGIEDAPTRSAEVWCRLLAEQARRPVREGPRHRPSRPGPMRGSSTRCSARSPAGDAALHPAARSRSRGQLQKIATASRRRGPA